MNGTYIFDAIRDGQPFDVWIVNKKIYVLKFVIVGNIHHNTNQIIIGINSHTILYTIRIHYMDTFPSIALYALKPSIVIIPMFLSQNYNYTTGMSKIIMIVKITPVTTVDFLHPAHSCGYRSANP